MNQAHFSFFQRSLEFLQCRNKLAGCKENHFYSLPFGQAEARVYQPRRHFKQPQTFLTSRIDFTVLLLFKFLKKHHLPVGQLKNRIHLPDSKFHQPRAIGHYFLCTLTWQFNNNFICSEHYPELVSLWLTCQPDFGT